MTFPSQTITVKDPGTPTTAPVATIPVISGCSVGGSLAVNTPKQISQIGDVRGYLGYGQLAEDVALAISKRGGPVIAVRHNATGTALSAQAMTQVGTGLVAPTIDGTPNDRYSLQITIVLGGTVGTATFKYSLDAWDSDYAAFTQSNVRATAATFVIPNTGLTINFTAGTYVAGDTFTLATVPAEVGATDLASVATALETNPQLDFHKWLVSGVQPDKATAATVAAAFDGHLSTLTNTYRYVCGFIDAASSDTSANAASEVWTSTRICPGYGFVLRSSLMPFEGFSVRKCSAIVGVAVRSMGSLISTDMARFADGPDTGVLKIYFDSLYDQTVDTDGISTMRTWPGSNGYYIAGGKIKCPFGSNFTDVQYRSVMDVAERAVYLQQLNYEADSLRTVVATDSTNGTIDPRDANQIEQEVTNALADDLTRPNNARGTPGHVSAFTYTIDRTVDLASTGDVVSTVTINPLGYPKSISTTLLFNS